jgi:hypothetical protein
MSEKIELSPELEAVAVWILKLLTGVGYLFAAWSLFGLSQFVAQGEHQLLLESAHTTGTVVAHTSRPASTARVSVVEFSPVGIDETYRFQDNLGTNRSIPSVGSSVPVLYVKDDPSLAIIEKGPFLNWLSQYIMLAVLAGSLFGVRQLRLRQEQIGNRNSSPTRTAEPLF